MRTRNRKLSIFCFIVLALAVGIAWPAAYAAGGLDVLAVTTDQPTYAAGATVHISGSLAEDGLAFPFVAISIQVNGPSGNIVFVGQSTTDPQGLFQSSYPLPSGAAPGRYLVTAGAIGFSAQVAFYRGLPPDLLQPSSLISSPADGANLPEQSLLVTGTASDDTGLRLVEVSTDNGLSWAPAGGTTAWRYYWPRPAIGTYQLRTRATDLAGKIEVPGPGITVHVIPGTVTYSLSPGWNMVSVPVLTSTNPEVVFGGLPYGWRLFAWDPAQATYLDQTHATIAIGLGYWLKVSSVISYTVSGLPNPQAETAIPLLSGWNMIGEPYTTPISWDAIQVSKDAQPPVSLNQAVTNGWLLNYAFHWNGSTYTTIGTGSSFQPLAGYWMKAKTTGLVLTFPRPIAEL